MATPTGTFLRLQRFIVCASFLIQGFFEDHPEGESLSEVGFPYGCLIIFVGFDFTACISEYFSLFKG
jgi:membrane-bound acyltransferase YfiQ involved in biofilm formation